MTFPVAFFERNGLTKKIPPKRAKIPNVAATLRFSKKLCFFAIRVLVFGGLYVFLLF